MRLDPRAIAAVIDVCGLRYTTEGEVLLEQGQPGNYFFVVKEGTFALKVTDDPVATRLRLSSCLSKDMLALTRQLDGIQNPAVPFEQGDSRRSQPLSSTNAARMSHQVAGSVPVRSALSTRCACPSAC